MNQRQIYEQQYNSGRANLLAALIFTVANIVILMTGGEMMMLFSISFPYLIVVYAGVFAADVLMVVALISLIAYFLFWLLSKKRPGFLIAALVCMILDTLLLALMYLSAQEASGIMDVLFHIWIVYYLFNAVRANAKLKKLPPEPVVEAQPQEMVNSIPLRRVEEGEKSRLLLYVEWEGYRVCYRRVKKVNQLVINDHVYDELEFLVEPPHELKATVNGHQFAVGYNGNSSYFNFDGEQIKKKIRWI